MLQMSKSNPFKDKAFLDIKQIWDKKLKDSGFLDIEKLDKRSGEYLLMEWDSHYFQSHYDPLAFEARQEYYLRCNQFLNNHTFTSKTDIQIWQLHSRGLGVRQIAEWLKIRGVKTNKDQVASIVNRLKSLMKEAPKCEKKTSLQLELWSVVT